MLQPASIALDGGDPRAGLSGEGIAEYSRAALKMTHDPSVTTEEYFYYAKLTRAEEAEAPAVHHPKRKILGFGKNKGVVTEAGVQTTINMPSTESGSESDEKKVNEKQGSPTGTDLAVISDEEWIQASRAARTATWGAVFYLITTDVLGPYSVPWAMSQMGYGPGVTLYIVFGALARYTGWQIWQMFLRLDSNKYPMKTFGDIAFRVYGTFARHLINALQSIQLLFNVGVIVIANGQGLYEINANICFIVCCVIWTVLGMVIGQIRTLQKFGWIANFAIWINIVVMIMTIAVVTYTAPNYSAAATANGVEVGTAGHRPAVTTTSGPPPNVAFTGQVVGLMQAVYSYGGGMIYCEFMSEMKRPMDFWKALIMADSFIFFVYLFFGVYVYSFQGQYTINPANQGMSPQGVLTAGNIIGFVSSLIAAALYGNIGIKVLYQNIAKELFGLPDLTSKKGKLIWMGIVPIYCAFAWILAAAIPNFRCHPCTPLTYI